MIICIVTSGDLFSDYGGGQVYVRNIVDGFIGIDSVTISVISLCGNLQLSTKYHKGVPIYQVNNEKTLKKAIQNISPDIVHANGEKLLTARICKELNIPCIVTAHHGGIVCPAGALLNADDKICKMPASYSHCLKCYLKNIRTGLFWYPLLRHYNQQHYIRIGKCLRHLPFIPFLSPIGETGLIISEKLAEWKKLAETAPHFIAPSDAIADALVRNGCPTEKITIIPHGIPIRPTTYTIQPTPNVKFYYVGRINHIKGIHVMFKAFAAIDKNNIELHIIGDAAQKNETRYKEKLKRKYHKDKRIVWHGKVPYEQMYILTKEFHCLIHPTICLEVFGLDIAEALQQHKYVIATRCGGSEMQIRDENDGCLVEANDAQSLKNAIEQFIKHPRKSFAMVHSIDDHIKQLMQIYARHKKQ